MTATPTPTGPTGTTAGWHHATWPTRAVHWWRPDGRAACADPADNTRYTGPKTPAGEVRLVDVCPTCVGLVAAAVDVIGDTGALR